MIAGGYILIIKVNSMKKIIQILLVLSLVFLVSCTTRGNCPYRGTCPYMKAKGMCESGCTASCDKAKEMKSEMDKSSCGAGKSGEAKDAKSCGAAKCGASAGQKSCN